MTSASNLFTVSSSKLVVKAIPVTGDGWSSVRFKWQKVIRPAYRTWSHLSSWWLWWQPCKPQSAWGDIWWASWPAYFLSTSHPEQPPHLNGTQFSSKASKRLIFLHPSLKMIETSHFYICVPFKIIYQGISYSFGRFTPLNYFELVNINCWEDRGDCLWVNNSVVHRSNGFATSFLFSSYMVGYDQPLTTAVHASS